VDLERLIATEQRLDEALQQARAEAEGLIRQAEAAAHRADADLEAELEQRARSALAEAARARRRAEEEIAGTAADLVARYEAVADAQVEQAADRVVQRLVAGEAT
jgi:F0F1-type ATP synthase membrane subunit b/b'